MSWRSERHAILLYRASQKSVVDLSLIKTFDAYNVNLQLTQSRIIIVNQIIQDFNNFNKNYSDEMEIHKDKDCISDYRGDWGEDEIHEDLLQETPSQQAMDCLRQFRDMQIPIKESVLYCSYKSAESHASIESALTSTTTSLPVLFNNSIYNQLVLFVIFINKGSKGVPIISSQEGMGSNEDCEVLLCDERKPKIIATATRAREDGKVYKFEGDEDAIAIFKICTEKAWSKMAKAKTLHVCQF